MLRSVNVAIRFEERKSISPMEADSAYHDHTMPVSLRAIAIALICAFGLSQGAGGQPAARSVSTSRQFIVYGADARLRGVVCDLAEQVKKNLLGLLQQKDEWRTPVVINAQYPQANLPETAAAALNFSQTGFGLKLQLQLTMGSDVSGAGVEREILRAILLERIYRPQGDLPAGTVYVQPPDWLLEGFLAAQPGRYSVGFSEALGAVVRGNRIVPFEEFLRQQPRLLDSQSQSLYRAYSWALVQLLINLPDGRGRLARFIADLPRSSSQLAADLKKHFPGLADANGNVEKAWSLGIAQLSASERYRLLGIAETEQRLHHILEVRIAKKDGSSQTYQLEDFKEFIGAPTASRSFQRVAQELLLLTARANPIYRPIILEYQKAAALLASKKTKGIAAKLSQIKSLRGKAVARMSAIDDYLNWFEATQSRTQSGVFTEYMKAAELALEREPRRRDPISVYLDAIETQFRD